LKFRSKVPLRAEESKLESKERTTRVSNLTDSLGITKAGIRTLIQIGSEHQQQERELLGCLLRQDHEEEQIFVSSDFSV
jgi:hypothetical protein